MLEYCYKACEVGIKERIIDMATNASGIRDTARVLGIDKNTVISPLKKKKSRLVQVNPNFQQINDAGESEVSLKLYCEEAKMDEQWSFVGNQFKSAVFGKRKDVVFKKLQALLKPFNIKRYYTDGWGAYERNIPTNEHEIGKANTQKIERNNLSLRTWIKRLSRIPWPFLRLVFLHQAHRLYNDSFA
jgi:IS1 family transposase